MSTGILSGMALGLAIGVNVYFAMLQVTKNLPFAIHIAVVVALLTWLATCLVFWPRG